MSRASWFDDKAEHPVIQEQLEHLESFTSALADSIVSKQELAGQEQRLIQAMKNVEDELNDAQHAKVTTLLVELSAYNVMRTLNELQTQRARMAFGRP
jgi:predicted transcriptional regulator